MGLREWWGWGKETISFLIWGVTESTHILLLASAHKHRCLWGVVMSWCDSGGGGGAGACETWLDPQANMLP